MYTGCFAQKCFNNDPLWVNFKFARILRIFRPNGASCSVRDDASDLFRSCPLSLEAAYIS